MVHLKPHGPQEQSGTFGNTTGLPSPLAVESLWKAQSLSSSVSSAFGGITNVGRQLLRRGLRPPGCCRGRLLGNGLLGNVGAEVSRGAGGTAGGVT